MHEQDLDARAVSNVPDTDDVGASQVVPVHDVPATFERREFSGEFFGYRWEAEVRVWQSGGVELVTVLVRDPSGQPLASLRPREAPHASIESAASKAEALARAVLR